MSLELTAYIYIFVVIVNKLSVKLWVSDNYRLLSVNGCALPGEDINEKIVYKTNTKVYDVQQLVDGVDLFKVEVSGCLYEVYKSSSGKWKLLYRLPNCRELPLELLGNMIDSEMSALHKREG